MKYREVVNCRMSGKQKRKLQRLSEKTGYPVSEVVRQLVTNAKVGRDGSLAKS